MTFVCIPESIKYIFCALVDCHSGDQTRISLIMDLQWEVTFPNMLGPRGVQITEMFG